MLIHVRTGQSGICSYLPLRFLSFLLFKKSLSFLLCTGGQGVDNEDDSKARCSSMFERDSPESAPISPFVSLVSFCLKNLLVSFCVPVAKASITRTIRRLDAHPCSNGTVRNLLLFPPLFP